MEMPFSYNYFSTDEQQIQLFTFQTEATGGAKAERMKYGSKCRYWNYKYWI